MRMGKKEARAEVSEATRETATKAAATEVATTRRVGKRVAPLSAAKQEILQKKRQPPPQKK